MVSLRFNCAVNPFAAHSATPRDPLPNGRNWVFAVFGLPMTMSDLETTPAVSSPKAPSCHAVVTEAAAAGGGSSKPAVTGTASRSATAADIQRPVPCREGAYMGCLVARSVPHVHGGEPDRDTRRLTRRAHMSRYVRTMARRRNPWNPRPAAETFSSRERDGLASHPIHARRPTVIVYSFGDGRDSGGLGIQAIADDHHEDRMGRRAGVNRRPPPWSSSRWAASSSGPPDRCCTTLPSTAPAAKACSSRRSPPASACLRQATGQGEKGLEQGAGLASRGLPGQYHQP